MTRRVDLHLNVETQFDILANHLVKTGGAAQNPLEPVGMAALEFSFGIFHSKFRELGISFSDLLGAGVPVEVDSAGFAEFVEAAVDVMLSGMILFAKLNIPYDQLLEDKIRAHLQKRMDSIEPNSDFKLSKPEGYEPANIQGVLASYVAHVRTMQELLQEQNVQQQVQTPVEVPPAANS